MTASLSIGRLAREAGVGVETVRFYEREGLMPEPARTRSGYRRYDPSAVERLRFIRRAKALGFSLGEIRELLALATGGGERAQVKAQVTRKLAEIDRRRAELARMRAALAELDSQCSGAGPIAGCPIIAALSGAGAS